LNYICSDFGTENKFFASFDWCVRDFCEEQNRAQTGLFFRHGLTRMVSVFAEAKRRTSMDDLCRNIGTVAE
jgi:hypothetical protein